MSTPLFLFWIKPDKYIIKHTPLSPFPNVYLPWWMVRSGWLCCGLRPRNGTLLTRVGRMVLTGEQMTKKALTTVADFKDHKSIATLLTNVTKQVLVKRKELQTSVVNLDFALYFEISLASASPYDYAFKMAQRGRRSASITERGGCIMYFSGVILLTWK